MAHDIGLGVVAVRRHRRPLHGRLPTPQTVSSLPIPPTHTRVFVTISLDGGTNRVIDELSTTERQTNARDGLDRRGLKSLFPPNVEVHNNAVEPNV